MRTPLTSAPLFCLLASACLALPTTQPRGPVIPTPVSDREAFVQALLDIGVEVVEVESGQPIEFGVPGEVLQAGTELLQVFQFETTQSRKAAEDTISPDGSVVNGRTVAWRGPPTIWSSGRLIVTYDGIDGGLIQVISGILGDPITLEPPSADEPYPPALLRTMQQLASEIGSDPATMEVVLFEPRVWKDACLELPHQDESCEASPTPGWFLRLRAGGREYRYHTDELGLDIRRDG